MIDNAQPSAIELALTDFRAAMLAKFRARDTKQGERSVTRVGNTLLNQDGVLKGLWEHFESEVREFRQATSLDDSMGEAIDVANMAFLIWWREQKEN
mgnify:CR=1 FL=1